MPYSPRHGTHHIHRFLLSLRGALLRPQRGQRSSRRLAVARLLRPGLSFLSSTRPGQRPAPLRPRAARPGADSAPEPRLLRRRRHRNEDSAARQQRPCGGERPGPAPTPARALPLGSSSGTGTPVPIPQLGPGAARGRPRLYRRSLAQPTPHCTAPRPGAPAPGARIDRAESQSPVRNLGSCPITDPEIVCGRCPGGQRARWRRGRGRASAGAAARASAAGLRPALPQGWRRPRRGAQTPWRALRASP